MNGEQDIALSGPTEDYAPADGADAQEPSDYFRLAALREISEMASAQEGLETLFERIVYVVCELLDVDICSVMLPDEEDPGVLRIHAARGLSPEVVERARVPVGERIAGRVLGENRTLLIENVEEMPHGQIDKSGSRYRNKSLLSVPIRIKGRAVGVLNVNNKGDGAAFGEGDRALLETICNQAGMAIENARLVFDLVEKNRRLSEANRDLTRLNGSKNELIVNLSHEFRTPLAVILGYADLLDTFWKKGELGKFPEWITSLRRQVGVLEGHLSRIFDFFSVEAGEHDWTRDSAGLGEILDACAGCVRGLAEERGVGIDLSPPPEARLRCHREFLEKAITAVLENAVRFTGEGARVRVRTDLIAANGGAAAAVRIEDRGPGIPADLVSRVFEDFKQTNDVMVGKPDGLGLGLSLAKTIMRRHGGDCRLLETGPAGTTFELTIPVTPR